MCCLVMSVLCGNLRGVNKIKTGGMEGRLKQIVKKARTNFTFQDM